MRHQKSGRKLNRNSAHRKALFKNLSLALIEHEIIKTTVPKAKELKKYLEPLITVSKNDYVHSVLTNRNTFNPMKKILPIILLSLSCTHDMFHAEFKAKSGQYFPAYLKKVFSKINTFVC